MERKHYSDKAPPMVSDEVCAAAEALLGANLQARSEEWIRAQLAVMLKIYKPTAIGRNIDQTWYRARLCETAAGFASLNQVLYRPAAQAGFGRANLPGHPVFYGSWNVPITMDEIGAQVGDYVQVVSCRIQQGHELPCLVVGEYQSMEFSGGSLINSRLTESVFSRQRDSDIATFRTQVYLDSVLAQLFRREATRPHEYKATAIFASIMHRTGAGLMYPSVRLPGGINIAVPAAEFDRLFEVISTSVKRITRCYGYGLYEVEGTRDSCDFDPEGVIRWGFRKEAATSNLEPAGRHPSGGGLRRMAQAAI